jgi:hypothetical protein
MIISPPFPTRKFRCYEKQTLSYLGTSRFDLYIKYKKFRTNLLHQISLARCRMMLVA